MKAPTKIKLVSKSGIERDFKLDHAQNLLDYEKQNKLSNWSIPDNSPFILQDGTIQRRNINPDKKAGKSRKAI
jgi:hypothetical protein